MTLSWANCAKQQNIFLNVEIPGQRSLLHFYQILYPRFLILQGSPFGVSVGCSSNIIGTFRFNFTDDDWTSLITKLISERYHVLGEGSTRGAMLPLRRAQPQPVAWRHFTAITFQKTYTRGEQGGGTVANCGINIYFSHQYQ